jgi:hypothetical protein
LLTHGIECLSLLSVITDAYAGYGKLISNIYVSYT